MTPDDPAVTETPDSATPGIRSDRAALSRDLADFLIELSISIHKHAMYPPGHPTLGPAVNQVLRRLTELFSQRQTLSLGVAREQLVIEGVATDSKNAVLKDLAIRLHEHRLGAITFAKGASAFEIERFLQEVAADPERTGAALGVGNAIDELHLPNIKLFPVAYDQLRLVDDEETVDEQRARESATRSGQLWIGLARAAMALDELVGDDDNIDAEPSLVANAIQERRQDSAYDQVIVGYLLQAADQMKNSRGAETKALQARMNKLISHLEQPTLRRLLKMGGQRGQRLRFVYDANQGMSADAVLKIVNAASQTEEQTVSDSFLRILQKMAFHAEAGPPEQRHAAENTVREQISDLIETWSLADPNPDEYTLGLQRMASAAPEHRIVGSVLDAAESERVVQMALEIDTSGPAISDAVDELVSNRRTKWLVDALEESASPTAEAAIWRDLASVERLEAMLAEDPLDVDALDGVLEKLGPSAAEPMLEALTEAESRQMRRVLLDRLVKIGHAVAPLAVARLADSRWYVQRNMLAIIGELPELPEGFRAEDFFEHPDTRVRREALRIMVRHPVLRERAICRAIADFDEQTARFGLAAAAQDCPKSAVLLVVRRATSGDNEALRLAALRILGGRSETNAINVLIQIAEPRKKLVGYRLPPKTPDYLEALRGLSRHAGNPRVDKVLAAARASGDDEIERAASPKSEAS